MTTRFNSKSKPQFGVSGLSSGFDSLSSPDDVTIPPVGVEDVDAALFHLFDKEIPFQVSTSDKNRSEVMKVPVIFASAEKWALAKRQRALRDRNGSLILPLITVVRTTIEQSMTEDVTGRGINQQTGEIIVRRRLDRTDRRYQKVVNRLYVKNQQNLAVRDNEAIEGQLTTVRAIGDLADDPNVIDGGLLMPDRNNNVYETVVVPSPQFFTAVYDVTFWAQYTVQMFQMLETTIASFLPQGNTWKLDTPKGYWFIASVDGNVYNAEQNVEDMSQDERIIKHRFIVKVPGYILSSKSPGVPIAIKRYVSAPVVSFDVGAASGNEVQQNGNTVEPFLGADDPTLPLSDGNNRRRDQRETGSTKLYPNPNEISPQDPALNREKTTRYQKIAVMQNGKKVYKYVRIKNSNPNVGESTFSIADLGGLNIIVPSGE